MPAVEMLGRSASAGLAAGPLFRLGEALAERTATGNLDRERADLSAAIAAAVRATVALMARVETEASEILEFQVALLEDEELSKPAFDLIAQGADASTAWIAGLAPQIADYESSEDDYFRARATDLIDLRDRVLRALSGVEASDVLPDGAVMVGDEITPSQFLSVDWSRGGGIALFAGSPSSHVAMLARSRGVPMIVGLGALDLAGHADAIVDAYSGRVILSPRDEHRTEYEAARAREAGRAGREAEAALRPARTRDGVPVSVMINVAGPEELAALDPAICDGIGLVRTEFLFHHGIPDEETQVRAYRRILEWAAPKPVVLRTLDAGGDKPIPGLTIDGESNPFLGTRGIRLCLARPDIFRIQLRAMARAAAHGNAKIMLPMVTVPEEIDHAAALLDDVVAQLAAEGIPHARPPLGIMVEVPAVAVVPDLFARAAFFSIGSNDLTQYVTAAARDIAAVSSLVDPGHPAVVALVARVVDAGLRLGIDVSLCGDMGGDPRHIPALLAAGLRAISVAPPQLGRAKLAVAAADSR